VRQNEFEEGDENEIFGWDAGSLYLQLTKGLRGRSSMIVPHLCRSEKF
jgi:hypothetical protein